MEEGYFSAAIQSKQPMEGEDLVEIRRVPFSLPFLNIIIYLVFYAIKNFFLIKIYFSKKMS